MGDFDLHSRERARRFTWRVIALMLLTACGLFIVGGMVYRATDEFVEQSALVAHTLEVKQTIVSTVAILRDAEAAQRAYVISSQPARLADYYGALPKLVEIQQQLHRLVADNRPQAEAAAALQVAIGTRSTHMATLLEAFQKGGIDGFRSAPALVTSREEDQAIDALASLMLAREDELLGRRHDMTLHTANVTIVLTLGAIGLGFAMMSLALLLVLREQKRRMQSEAAVRRSHQQLAESLEASRQLGHTLRQLSALGEMLQGCQTIDEAIAGLQAVLPSLLPQVSGSINLIDDSQQLVEAIAGWGEPPLSAAAAFAPDDCWALRRGHAYPQEGAIVDFPCKHFPAEALANGSSRLCMPLLAQGEMLGTLVLSSAQAFDADARGVATAAAEHISMAISNLKLQETLRRQSLRDPLTGLFNRRYLEASLERELSRAARQGQSLAVLMLDVDHFKRFNDEHGHDGGDALLAQFGALVASLVRNEDVACRYGGEEFTVLLQDADATLALRRAQAICEAVRKLQVNHLRRTLGPVSVSIGIACYPDDGRSGDELLRVADRALYAAKHGGRNQARLADARDTLSGATPDAVSGVTPIKSVPLR